MLLKFKKPDERNWRLTKRYHDRRYFDLFRIINRISRHRKITVESRFLDPSIFQTSRYKLEPNFSRIPWICFTPDISNSRFLEAIFVSLEVSRNRDPLSLYDMSLWSERDILTSVGVRFIF